MSTLTRAQVRAFQKSVADYFATHRREMPWRVAEADGSFDAYKILVSEMMLQQTQVGRVIPKFTEFVAKFPNLESLARAPLNELMRAWQGLGYNRRAKFLHDAAHALISKDKPWKYEVLVGLKGIGPNTAGAVIAYAYNQPVVFIETNIRGVFIHHFFKGQTAVGDKEIRLLVEQTLDRSRPREWFWALMDYGAFLKSTVGNAAKASKSYTKQSAFQGSRRQLRGQVIRLLAERSHSVEELENQMSDERLSAVLRELAAENLIRVVDRRLELM